jgi:DNA-directed RNA polymerase specialized sigma24 family protein
VAAPEGDAAADESGGAPLLAPAADVDDRRDAGEALTAMAALSPALRMPLALREVYGYEYVEIALLLRRPVGTVKAAVHRGRKALRAELSARGVSAEED